MLQLIYTSVATVAFSDDDLNELLFKSRRKNEAADITGMLLYDRGTFLQVLEGPDQAIKDLYDTIRKDPRHERQIVLSERNINEREFSQWRMGFVKMSKDSTFDLPGFEDFFEGEPDLSHCSKDATLTRRILMHFRNGMWHREQAA